MAQHSHYTKRRKEVWGALHPEPSRDYSLESYDGEGEEMGGTTCPTHHETDALGRKKSPQQAQSFAAATSEVTGQSKRDINRNVARAEAIGPPNRHQLASRSFAGLPAAYSISGRSVPLPVSMWIEVGAIANEVENRIGNFAHQPPVLILDTAIGFLSNATSNSHVAGAVHRGKIYLFRGELASLRDVKQTLFHELLHYGIQSPRYAITAQLRNVVAYRCCIAGAGCKTPAP